MHGFTLNPGGRANPLRLRHGGAVSLAPRYLSAPKVARLVPVVAAAPAFVVAFAALLPQA